MKRADKAREAGLWARVTATVTPLAGRPAQEAPQADPPTKPPSPNPDLAWARAPSPPPITRRSSGPKRIEPGRLRRIIRGAEAIERRLDLHGMDQDRARSALAAFIADARLRRCRTVLVITGKGEGGGGVLRRWAPEWLNAAELRDAVAGIAAAHPRHGGAGALYVALRGRVGRP